MHLRVLFLLLSGMLVPVAVFSSDPETTASSRLSKDSLKVFMSVLTADSLAGRETGQPGQKKAARYLSDSFVRFGLVPLTASGYQTHPLSVRANKDKNILINDQKFVYRNDFFTPASDVSGEIRSSRLVALQPRVFSSGALPRKIVKRIDERSIVCLTAIGSPRPVLDDSTGIVSFIKKQLAPFIEVPNPPRAILLQYDELHPWFEWLNAFDRSGSSLHEFLHQLPFKVYWISKQLLEAALNGPADFNRIQIKKASTVLPFITKPEELVGENVPFIVRGSEKPDEYVAVTAHYDHLGVRGDTIFYGADDDASGTTALLEMARVFSDAASNGNPPRRSILFMPVSGEEKGLLGSRYYSEHPLVPLEQTVADVNIDMIGRIDPEHDSLGIRDYVYVIGSDKLSSELHAINEAANEEHVQLRLDYRFNVPGEPNRFYFRSDHYNFAKHGIPSIFYFNGKHADYHKPTDTIEKIDFDVMEKRTRLVFHTVWELANRSDRILVDRASDMELPTKTKTIK